MQKSIGKSHRQYVEERIERDPEFAAALEEVDADLDFALELVRQRERRGWTQRQLAEVSGIKQPMIARIERGSQSPRYSTIRKLLHALEATITLQPDGRVTIRPYDYRPGVAAGEWRVREPARTTRLSWMQGIQLGAVVGGRSGSRKESTGRA